MIIIIIVWSIIGPFEFDRDLLQIYFIDVGQGDSILIVTPDQKTLLIDTGRNHLSVNALIHYLPPTINQIDYVVITHSDADHIGGLDELQGVFNIGELIVGKGEDFYLGCCVEIDFVWPTIFLDDTIEENAQSIALFLNYNGFSGFFGGDLGIVEEDSIARDYTEDGIDLLKVGHHGSKNSTSVFFIKRMKPEYAVISVGKNSYGHPHKQVLQTLSQGNAKILRTDESGDIILRSDGKRINITSSKQI